MPIMRSPNDTAEHMRKWIDGKVFCDLGSAGGVVVKGATKYASRAFGIERSKEAVKTTRAKGMEVIEGDVMNMDLPPAGGHLC